MIAYDRKSLDAQQTVEYAELWRKKGLFSEEKWQQIREQHPSGFYSPNVFVRIGLAVFCVVMLLAIVGLTGLILSPDSSESVALLGMLFGSACLFMLEVQLIRNKRHFGSGLDDVLLYAGTTAIISGLFLLFDIPDGLAAYIVVLPFLVAGSIRYLDRLMAAGAFVCTLLIVLHIAKDVPQVAVYVLPLTGMVFSLLLYRFARRGGVRVEWRYWHGVLAVVELLALLTFYASGNYWVVQQAGHYFFGMDAPPAGGLFWAFTFIVPAYCIFRGIRARDRLMLDVGIACMAAAVFTFRYYFNVLPLAWAAATGGAVLFLISWLSIRYLRKRPHSYAYEPEEKDTLLQRVQEEIFDKAIVGQAAPATTGKTSMEGGQFGGGGSGGDF
ncbi:MAG: hypothetical protein IPK76_17090 [Lewinellaceae bacterium]|jgi:hypothetical protein|nr:hypothetical protein [Lewinellaceae bacterium]